MQVSIHHGEKLIGTAMLKHLDPPMGVASGSFSPSCGYASETHANIVEGEYVGDRGVALAAMADQHGSLNADISIEDWSAPEIGKQLTLFFKNGEDFAGIFAEHPDYKAYYPDLGNVR